ncbi:ParA family protein [Bradyrhizobium sp. 44]|uniref:ParA family protein n=1 Tax=Bradyrhizobium sp. 44 TaxID=2782675 RepID=UPI001FFBC0EB|nr:ParA family protein [Bradyrhizobium sp. 44]MCK1283441.1 ParA family protein [Bradyrhizobium sp. 44]
MKAAKKKVFVPVVAVLNMKGGVGKTTLSANIFRVLFERRQVRTLLLDLDPQFNLTQALFTRSSYDELKKHNRTILPVMEPASTVGLFDVATSTIPAPSAASLTVSLRHFVKYPNIKLDVIPGDFGLVKYSLMNDSKKLDKVRDRFLRFIEAEKENYGIICIDCNPSSSFLTLCALHACTHILAPVRPDRFSMLGLEILSQFVESLPSIATKPQLFAVLNGVRRGGKDSVATAVEAELRAHPTFASRTLINVVPETGVLKAKTDYTGFATDKKGGWSKTVRAEVSLVADELAKKLGL